MSDLQCAARFVVLDADALDDVDTLVARLVIERVAGLYAADDVAGDGAVLRLAQGLGLEVAPAVGDLAFGGAGYDDLADRHRGETVVLVRPGTGPHPTLLLVDADGWTTEEF